ncbi:MAG TPA: DUF1592 domain-containing protein [Polyangiaceae bacterium]
MRWLLLVQIGLLVVSLGCGSPSARGAAEAPRELAPSAKLLPARTRRLTNLELERSLTAFTGLKLPIAAELPPDVRQEGYTPNANQDVSAAWATRYASLVRELSERAARERPELAPCRELEQAGCRARLTSELGQRAFRRPLSADEQGALEQLLLEVARAGGSDVAGRALLLRALLESPSFLYLSELGAGGAPGGRLRLTDFELASGLSFTLRGGPPDSELLRAARAGELGDGAARIRQARRLLSLPDTRHQFRRFALEWLEVDGLAQTAKSSQLFPDYDALKPFMLSETEDYVDEVMVNGGASIGSLLASGFASVGPEMARFYGLSTYGARASLAGTGRLGVLQQASFLAAHAHEDVTSPVKRGDFVMRKLLCERIMRPGELGLEVVMPRPVATVTNRELLSQHASDPGCASCHTTLDAIGFSFEGFDAMGRAQSSDQGKPISTSVKLHLPPGAGAERGFASSEALTRGLLEMPVVSECFARHAFRYFSAQADPAVEASFLALRAQLPSERRDSLIEVLLAYVGSDLFALREVPR